MKLDLSDDDAGFLFVCLTTAAEKFRENAARLREYEPEGEFPIITKDAALMLAENFEEQERETMDLLARLSASEDEE